MVRFARQSGASVAGPAARVRLLGYCCCLRYEQPISRCDWSLRPKTCLVSRSADVFETIELLTRDEPVTAPAGLVYSTNPRTAEATDGRGRYFVKGPEPEIVFAEMAGCLLAGKVGLHVPTVAACLFDGLTYCGTREVADVGRNIEPWLRAPERVTNFSDVYSVIAVDVWLANTDRNMGNVLGRSAGKGRVDLIMIDFEKSTALRPNPTVQCPLVEAKKLWPREALGALLHKKKPIQPPTVVTGKIVDFVAKRSNVADVVGAVANVCPGVTWAENSIDVLVNRGSTITKLVGEVWAL